MKDCGISISRIKFEISKFPAGEIYIKININDLTKVVKIYKEPVCIFANVTSSDHIMTLIMLVDAIRQEHADAEIILTMPYVPYGRQDRVCDKGEAFSLKVFANIINSLNFKKVCVECPHSQATSLLFNNCKVYDSIEEFQKIYRNIQKDIPSKLKILAPDAGALKRCQSIADSLAADCLIANKVRNKEDGSITKVDIYGDLNDGDSIVIFDDICDGGRTFIELAKSIDSRYASVKKYLVVAFGIFSNGRHVVEEHYDEVIALNEFWEY